MVVRWYSLALAGLLALSASPASLQPPVNAAPDAAPMESTWSRYVTKKERKNALQSKMTKLAGFGGAMRINNVVATTWVTETAARWLVSDLADDLKLRPEEAESRYLTLRPSGSYLFLVNLRYANPFDTNAPRPSATPLVAGQTVLQRKDDLETFSKASQETEIARDAFFPHGNFEHSYYVVVPRTTQTGGPVVRSMEDKIQFQCTIEGKKIVLEFSVKDFAASVEEL